MESKKSKRISKNKQKSVNQISNNKSDIERKIKVKSKSKSTKSKI